MATATRLTRTEAKQRTEDRLIEAARQVFLERGFHASSVAEIADRAGYTTGAIYSRFGGKDELFLAMLDAELAGRAVAQRDRVLEAETFEDAVRSAARDLHRAGARDPGMTPLTVEFWTYASPKASLRKRVRDLHERQMQWIAELLDEACERHGVRLRLSTEDVARGGGALSRGVRLERLLDPGGIAERKFVEMFTAYVTGLID